jgi:alpha-glucosidase (family GH31 glycosyl hydrolase)
LPSVIPAALSVGICGVNTWGPDIGGFFDAYDGSTTAESTELWIRWCQVGALSPLMRDHLGPKRMTTPGAVDLWSNEQTVDTWRRFAGLHNALFPYFYAYAWHAHETGVPTMRHLVLEFPDEAEALLQDHQYLLGNELLVAPVVEPNATTRQVWFPPGAWYSFWDGARFTGPGYVTVPAPIDQIPLFVRAGSILPLLARPVVTLADAEADDLLDDLELHVYPAGDDAQTSSILTFHDGSSIQLDEHVDGIVLTLDARNQERDLVVRISGDFGFVNGLADGVPFEPEVLGTGVPWLGNADIERSTRIRIPTGISSFTLHR